MKNVTLKVDPYKLPISQLYPNVIGDYRPNLPEVEEERLKVVRSEFMGYATSLILDTRDTQLAEEAAAVLVREILNPGYQITWKSNPISAYEALRSQSVQVPNPDTIANKLAISVEPAIIQAIGAANHQMVMSRMVNWMSPLLISDMPFEMCRPLCDSVKVSILSATSSLPFIAHYHFCQGLEGVKYSEHDSEILAAAVKFLKSAYALYLVNNKNIIICERPFETKLSKRGGIMDINFWGM